MTLLFVHLFFFLLLLSLLVYKIYSFYSFFQCLFLFITLTFSFHSFCSPSCHRQDALQRHWDKYCRKKSKRHVHRHRFYDDEGSYASDDSDSGVVLLGPAPGSGGGGGGGVLSRAEKEEDEAALGGASGVDLKSYRVISTSGRRRTMGVNKDRKGKGKARVGGAGRTKWVDGDGDVRMTDEDSDSEVDELESEDPLDGYRYEYDDDSDSVSEHERGEKPDCGDSEEEEEEEFDELDDSDVERRGREDVKSDAEGVSVSSGDVYTTGSEDSEEEEDVEGARVGRGRKGFAVGEGRPNGTAVFDRSAARQPPLSHPSKASKPESPLMTTKLAVTSLTNGFATAPSSVPNGEIYKPSAPTRRTPTSSSSRSAFSGSSSTRTPSAPPPPQPQVGADDDTVARHPPLPMSAFTSTFPAQPNMPRPRGAPGGRTRCSMTAAAIAATATLMVVPVTEPPSRFANGGNVIGNGQSVIALPPPPPPVSGPSTKNSKEAAPPSQPPRLRSHSRTHHHGPGPGPGPGRGPYRPRGSSSVSTRRRGRKCRRNDFDAILDPSQAAAQGGQIRMRVLPQATYMPPVQPALAIMHEQPQVAKRKGKRTDGLVPDYGFVPREYVYRERD